MASLKFNFNNEYRRVNLSSYFPNQHPVAYGAITKLITVKFLLEKIFAIYSPLLNEKQVKLSWIDQDGDAIKFSTDEELQDALYYQYKATENCTFKFNIELIPVAGSAIPSATPCSTQVPLDADSPVHAGVQCDECQQSPVRKNFDLCQNCESKQIQPFPMVKIYHPDQAPAAIFVAVNEDGQEGMGWRHGGRFGRGFGRHHGEGGGHHGFPKHCGGGRKFWKHFMKASGCPFPGENEDVPVETTAQFTQHSDAPFGVASQATPVGSATSGSTPAMSETKEEISKKPKARFVHDVTFPDGTTVPPGTVYLKIWKVRNDGTTSWPDGSVIVPAGGDLFTTADFSDLLPAAAAGEEVDVSVQLTAPMHTGRHVAYFRLQTKEGTNFGHRLWSDIRVSTEDDIDATSPTGWQVLSGILSQSQEGTETGEVDKEERQEEQPESTTTESASPVVVVDQPIEEPEVVEKTPAPTPSAPAVVSPYASELKTLADMGFVDETVILPLLYHHIPNPNGTPNPEGMQAVVMQLLSMSMSFR